MYVPRSRRPYIENIYIYDKVMSEWDLGSSNKIIISVGISMDMWGNVLRVLKVYEGEMVL